MKKYCILLILSVAFTNLHGQSSLTVGTGSNISISTSSDISAGYRNGSLSGAGTFNWRSLVVNPVATTAASITQSSFIANWNPVAYTSGYYLDVATNSSFTSYVSGYQNLNVGNVTSFEVNTNLSAGTIYYYRIRAYDIDGVTASSNVISVLLAPASPASLSATNINETNFSASWNNVSGANGYYVDVSTSFSFEAGSFVEGYQNKNVGNVTTINVNANIIGGTKYYYRVRAYNSSGTSNNSTVVDVLTLPTAPTVLVATGITQTSFTANWDTVKSAITYYLDVAEDTSFTNLLANYTNKDVGKVTSYEINASLVSGTKYYYRVRAYNGSGTGGNSNIIRVITIPGEPTTTAATNVSSTSFSANWDTEVGVEKYYLDVSKDSMFTNMVEGLSNKDVGNLNTYSVTSISGGSIYYYRVRSNNESGTSGNSNVTHVLTLPAAPAASSATGITQTSFTANWDTVKSTTTYYLDVAEDTSFTNLLANYTNKDVGKVTSYEINASLVSGTKYYYRVRAYNGSGTGGNSNIIRVITIPGEPTTTAATNVASTSFSANWNTVVGVEKYYLDVSKDSTFTNMVEGLSNKDVGNLSTYSVTSISGGSIYYYRVRSNNESGTSGNSNVTHVLTLPAAPAASSATGITQTSFTANWNAVKSATKYYLDIATDSLFTNRLSDWDNKEITEATTCNVNTSITNGTVYYYRVRAYNSSGIGINSNVIKLISIPGEVIIKQATNITAESFTANWNTVKGSERYYLDVSADSTFASFVNGWNNRDVGNAVSYQVNTAINSGTIYYYRLRAHNQSGTSGNSNVTHVLTLPAAPVASVASNITQTTFTANWNAVETAAKYYIDVATDSSFSSMVNGCTNKELGNVTQYLVNTGLVCGTKYYYRIRAYNPSGIGANSNVIELVTIPGEPVAKLPSNISNTSFNANWEETKSAGKYYLDVAVDSLFTNMVPGYSNKEIGNVTTYQINENIKSGITYYYRLRANNKSGTSGNSNIVCILTLPAGPLAKEASEITQTSFTANWNNVETATKYYLDVAADNLFTNMVSGWINKDVNNVNSYNVNTNLTSGTIYYYRVRAYNNSGIGLSSNVVRLITIPNEPVAKLATNIASNEFTANWEVTKGASNYYLDVAADSLFTNLVSGWSNKAVGNANAYTVTSVKNGTNYYYRIRANNASGTSGNSNMIHVLTLPAAAVANSASNIAQTSFTANWNSVETATKYYLDVASDSLFANTLSDWNNKEVIGSTISAINTNLTCGTIYFYRVRACNSSGVGTNSNIIKLITIPGEPVSKSASNINVTNFTANWDAVKGAEQYYLDVSPDSTFASFVTGWNSKNVGNTISYIVENGISADTRYYYRIRANNVSGTSGYSATKMLLTLPAAPITEIVTEISDKNLVAKWHLPSGKAVGYYLDVAADEAFTNYVSTYRDFLLGNVSSYMVENLASGTPYYYRVRAYNGTGISNYSNVTKVVTICSVPQATMASEITYASFVANWDSTFGAKAYIIDIAEDSLLTNFVEGYRNKNIGRSTKCTITGLKENTTYYYGVRSQNSDGLVSGVSNIISIKTFLAPPVSPVAKNSSVITQVGFFANWDSVKSATGYYLDVASDPSFSKMISPYNKLDVKHVTTYSINGLTPGAKYYYRVRAYNEGGESGHSNVSSALLFMIAPTELTSQIDSVGNLAILWKYDFKNFDASGFVVYRKPLSGNVFEIVDTVNGHAICYYDLNVEECKSYVYYVMAYNSAGANSGKGNQVTLTTPLKAPSLLKAEIVGPGKILLSWKDNSILETCYVIERAEATNKEFKKIYTVSADSCMYIDSNTKDAVKYFYRVTAVKDTLYSAYSNEVGITAVFTGVVGLSLGIPTEYALYQNYPNPFNPSTTIRFALPKSGMVKIKVYDITGRIIQTLVDKDFDAGYYEVMFDARGLASGAYIFTIHAGNFIHVKKMLLLR